MGEYQQQAFDLMTSAAKGFAGRCTYRHHGSSEGPSREQALNLYRTVQEALSNAMRHAGAETIDVELRSDGRKWVVEVRDDGRGFDTERPSGGMGMQIMRYRADLIGGELVVDSRLGEGTTVRCEVEVDPRTGS